MQSRRILTEFPDSSPPAETLRDAVRSLAGAFHAAGLETPDLDARRLVLEILSLDGTALLRKPDRPLDAKEQQRLAEARIRRLGREPVSRILGTRAFHGLDLEIAPATLDPRPDTETLVDGILKLVAEGRVPGGDAPRILDIGTGSGAILIALLHELPKASGFGTDISAPALAVAERNAARYGVSGRSRFKRTSWLDGIDSRFDLIVSNPPYIPTRDLPALEPEVALFDPEAALDGGLDGLVAYRAIANGLRGCIAPGGWVAVEVGVGQSDDVTAILANCLRNGLDHDDGSAHVWYDLGGIARCVAREARAGAIDRALADEVYQKQKNTWN
ncbi:MAG: peptide chain release factor N(5)-glutamine methyltransferase [Hyphomicrobiaceae bacterium]